MELNSEEVIVELYTEDKEIWNDSSQSVSSKEEKDKDINMPIVDDPTQELTRHSTILLDRTILVGCSSADSVESPVKYKSLDTPPSNIEPVPWISQFSKLCQKEVGLTEMRTLENLMAEYIRNVSTSVLKCYMKPIRSAKLKKTMNETLLLFHFFYSDIKKVNKFFLPYEHSSYLDKMSDLMAMYIDMETTALSRRKESLSKIASKVTTSLFVFLDRSHDHILDTMFKTKFINKRDGKLYNLIFSRVLRDSPGRVVCDLTYVRHVLAFRMWKKVVESLDEKQNIMKMAAAKLHPPPLFREFVKAGILSGILPEIPESKSDITMFLMEAKFSIKEKLKKFLEQINTSKKRSNIDRTPFSKRNDTDDSRDSSKEYQEVNRGGFTNNSRSSVFGESGVAHQIKMADVIEGKQLKNKCEEAKCKGISTPVFRTNVTQTFVTADKLKKKRRVQEISELAGNKPLSTSLLTEKCSNQSNIGVVRPRIESPMESSLKVGGDKSCRTPSSDLQPKDDCVLYQRDLSKEITPAKSLINFCQSSEVLRDSKQEYVKETVAGIQEFGRDFYKSHNKLPKSGADQQLNQILISENEAIREKCKSMLHDQTLRKHFNTFVSQHMFRSNLLNNTIPPETTVPSPFHNDIESEEALQCNCVQCTTNRTSIVTNYKTLTQYMENKRRVASEKKQDPDPASCPPFKKCKTVSKEKEEDEPDVKASPATRDDGYHTYPSTPMISIAMIDPKVQPLVSNTSPLKPLVC